MTCPHGFPSPAACWDCMQDTGLGPAPQQPADYRVEQTIRARFDGRCWQCGEPTRQRDTIHRIDGAWWCHDCVEALT